MKFAADPPKRHGTLTKYFLTPADFCYKIPDSMRLEEAVLMDSLAMAVHAVRLADVRPGNRVIVFGFGAVGLFYAAVAREFGASTVISVDVLARRLEFARKFIGNSVGRNFVPNHFLSVEEVARQLVRLGEGADIAIDASGVEASLQTAIFSLRNRGTFFSGRYGKAQD